MTAVKVEAKMYAVRLTAAERVLLKDVTERLGYRSEADTFRQLLRTEWARLFKPGEMTK